MICGQTFLAVTQALLHVSDGRKHEQGRPEAIYSKLRHPEIRHHEIFMQHLEIRA